jgi:alcohol dehydrogenase class IV
MKQSEYIGNGSIQRIQNILDFHHPHKIFLVTGKKSYSHSGAKEALNPILSRYSTSRFSDFSPNPKLEDIQKGIEVVANKGGDIIIAIGGGSVLDVAKAVNILSAQDGDPITYIKGERQIRKCGRPLIGVPTTTGSGSEATQFAVIYVQGIKYSLEHESILPMYAVVDPQLTLSMPKKLAASSSLDALSQAIESLWSVNSTNKSREYSEKAIRMMVKHIRRSVNSSSVKSREAMAESAHLAGKAINITKTTAAHALSYGITTRFFIAHGHAVALNLGRMLEYNADVTAVDCNDKRGPAYVQKVIHDLIKMLGCSNAREARSFLDTLIEDLGLENRFEQLGINNDGIEWIARQANIYRLLNNPRKLTDSNILSRILKT